MANTTLDQTPRGPMDRSVRPQWYKRRPYQLGMGVAVLTTLTGLAFIALPAPNTVTLNATSVDTGEVVRAAYQDYVPLRASVVPQTTIYITAETSGRVETVSVNDGEAVVAGQPLARLANPDLTLAVSSREADISGRLSDTNSQLMNLQTAREAREQTIADVAYALHKAEEDLAKKQLLRERDVLNDAYVKTSADEVAYQKSRLASLNAAQATATRFYADQRQQILASASDLRQSLNEARQSLGALTISAPAVGRLTDFNLKPGQSVKMGDPLGEVDSEGSYKLRAEVDEFYLSRLSAGLKAQAHVHDRDVTVHIAKVFPQVSNGHIVVELAFDNAPPADLTRGEAVDVRLSLGNTTQALLAPVGSWLNDTGGASVFVLNSSGTSADRRTITVGRRNPEYAEILSGLKPGDRIVTSGTQNLTKAQHIRFQKTSSQ